MYIGYIYICRLYIYGASQVAQRLKHLPAMRETWVRSLGQEDPLEKEMATHTSILAWKIPWMEEHGGLQSRGSQRVGHDWATSLHLYIYMTQTKVLMPKVLMLTIAGSNTTLKTKEDKDSLNHYFCIPIPVFVIVEWILETKAIKPNLLLTYRKASQIPVI